MGDGKLLILSRKINQKIWLTGDIWITVLDIHGDKVRLAIHAPKDVRIMREELLAKEQKETK